MNIYTVSDITTAAPASAVLDTNGFPHQSIYVESSAAADFVVEGSMDGEIYFPLETISLAAAGNNNINRNYAWRFLKVSTAAANDNKIVMAATR